MSWVVLAALAWFLFKLACWLRDIWNQLVDKAARYRCDLGEPRHRALALATPMALRSLGDAFFLSTPLAGRDEHERRLRAALLHVFQLPGDISADQLRRDLPPLLRTRWFSIDLRDTPPDDDPAAALAFACGRVACVVRLAGLLGWIDEDTQWQVLQQNAERARECFDGWLDYGRAWARGRRQWVARSRADGLGSAFTEADVQGWIEDRVHPWNHVGWGEAPARPEPA